MTGAEENIQRDATEKNDKYLSIWDTTITHIHVSDAQCQRNEDQGSRNVLRNGHSPSPVSGVYAGYFDIRLRRRAARPRNPPFFTIVLLAGVGSSSETRQKGRSPATAINEHRHDCDQAGDDGVFQRFHTRLIIDEVFDFLH